MRLSFLRLMFKANYNFTIYLLTYIYDMIMNVFEHCTKISTHRAIRERSINI